MRPELIRFATALAILAGGALFPATASRAGLGSMFESDPCPSMNEVIVAYTFRESFVGLAKCESLCRKAATSCKQAVKAASSCQLAFASDYTAFDKAVDCSGLSGGDLKECKAGWAADLKAWHRQLKASRDQFVGTCDALLNDQATGCLRRCSGV